VDGILRARKDSATILFLPESVVVEGALQRVVGREISVPSLEIIEMEQRQFRAGRTALAVVGGAIVVALMAASVRNAERPVQLPPDPDHPEARLRVLLSAGIWR